MPVRPRMGVAWAWLAAPSGLPASAACLMSGARRVAGPSWSSKRQRSEAVSQPELGAVVIEGPPPRRSTQSAGREAWKVALIADRRLSLAALSASLLRGSRYRFIEETRGTIDVHDLLNKLRPAVLVMDYNDGRSFRAIDPSPWDGRVLALLDPDAEAPLPAQAVPVRPAGFLARSAGRGLIDAAIDSLAAAELYLDPLLSTQVSAAMQTMELG